MTLLEPKPEIKDRTKHRVFLVDDHPLVREWLTNLINHHRDLIVCGEAEDSAQALQAIEATQPDITIIDLTLANGSGIELIKDLKRTCPNVATIVLSMHDESVYGERAIRAGARGYVMKSETTKKIIAALRQVLAGKIYVSEELQASLAARMIDRDAGGSRVDQLSDRELEVFKLLGQGCETRKIAEMLNISMKTVQVYYARMKDKLDLENVTELVREAVRWSETKV